MQDAPAAPSVQLKETLAEAHRAKLQGRYSSAISLYEYAQTLTNNRAMIACRLAPLLAYEGRHFEAWRQFQRAGRALMRDDQPEWALSVYCEATRMLPLEFDAWRICASIERRLGRTEHALETLLEGRRHFRSALYRDQAIALLTLAQKIDPGDLDILIDIANLLHQGGQVRRARALLEERLEHGPETDISRLLAARSRLTWSPRHAFRWFESFLRDLLPRAQHLLRPRFRAMSD